MVKVKICGITNYDDASMAVDLGADALGFVFAPSSRKIEPDNARDIISKLPPYVKTVGVFVNEDTDKIINIVKYCALDSVQLHGDESADTCKELMPRSIKALRIKDGSTPEQCALYKGRVRAFLLDTYSKKMAGGTGKTFNWDIAVKMKALGIPIILAGGLTASNIKEAIQKVKPYGIDISSGVEERAGKKDHLMMKELFENLRE